MSNNIKTFAFDSCGTYINDSYDSQHISEYIFKQD